MLLELFTVLLLATSAISGEPKPCSNVNEKQECLADSYCIWCNSNNICIDVTEQQLCTDQEKSIVPSEASKICSRRFLTCSFETTFFTM